MLAPPRARREGPVAESVSAAQWASTWTLHQYDIALRPSALAASQASQSALSRPTASACSYHCPHPISGPP